MRLVAAALLFAASGARAEEPARRKLAGLVVRSDDYAIRRGDEVVEEWTGNVVYRRQGQELSSDRAERRHARDQWRARGRVRGSWKFKDGSGLKAQGEEATHDGERNAGTLRPQPGRLLSFELQSKGQSEPDRGEAGELSWDLPADAFRLSGDVRTWGPSGRVWAERAVYDRSKSSLVLAGNRPVLVSGSAALREKTTGKPRPRVESRKDGAAAERRDWNGAVQADRIEAVENPRRILAKGAVKGWVVFEGADPREAAAKTSAPTSP